MSTPDDQHQQIIEAGKLALRLYHIENEDAELEQVGRAFDAALAPLRSDSGAMMAMMMVMNLLDGKPFLLTSNTPENIRRCIAIAHKISATVEASESAWADATPGLRSIRIDPPSQAK